METAVSLEDFHHSEPLTLGVELELQLANTHDYDLAPYAEDMLRLSSVRLKVEQIQLVSDGCLNGLGSVGLQGA